jgi:hypothetical protein
VNLRYGSLLDEDESTFFGGTLLSIKSGHRQSDSMLTMAFHEVSEVAQILAMTVSEVTVEAEWYMSRCRVTRHRGWE